jgi:hypothetical protein
MLKTETKKNPDVLDSSHLKFTRLIQVFSRKGEETECRTNY